MDTDHSTQRDANHLQSLEPSIFLHGLDLFCGWCMCSFQCPIGLKIHVNIEHQQTCPCGKEFTTIRSLLDHAREFRCPLPFPYEWKHFDGSTVIHKSSVVASMPSVVDKCSKQFIKQTSKLHISKLDENVRSKLEISVKKEAAHLGKETKPVKSSFKKLYDAPEAMENFAQSTKCLRNTALNLPVKKRKKSKWSAEEIKFLRSCFSKMIGGLLRCRLCSHVYAQWKTSYLHICLAHEAEFSKWKADNSRTLSRCSIIMSSSEDTKSFKKETGSLTPVAIQIKKCDTKMKTVGKSVKKTYPHPITISSDLNAEVSTSSPISKQNGKVVECLDIECAGTVFKSSSMISDSLSGITVDDCGPANDANKNKCGGTKIRKSRLIDDSHKQFLKAKQVTVQQYTKFCVVCCKTFDNISRYMHHLKQKNRCADVFSYLKSQCKRLDDGRVECQICKTTCPTPSRLYSHIRCDHDLPPTLNNRKLTDSSLAGDRCKMAKSGKRWMISLQMKKTPKKKSYCCPLCHLKINSRSSFYKHKVICRIRSNEKGKRLKAESDVTVLETRVLSIDSDPVTLATKRHRTLNTKKSYVTVKKLITTVNDVLYSACIKVADGFRCKFCDFRNARRYRLCDHLRKCHAELVDSSQNSHLEKPDHKAKDPLDKSSSVVSMPIKTSTKSPVTKKSSSSRCVKCECSFKSCSISDMLCAKCTVKKPKASKRELSYLADNCERRSGKEFVCRFCGLLMTSRKIIYRHIRRDHGIPDK